MKVLILGFDRFDSLEWNLCDTFKRMGIECRIIDPYRHFPFNFRFKLQTLLRFSKRMEDLFWNRFINNLRGLKADLIISTLQNLPPENLAKVKHTGLSPIIMWNPDPIYALFASREYSLYGDYDLYIVEFPYMENYLKNVLHKPVICLPEGFNPSIHSPPNIPKAEAEKNGPDIVIAGTLYYERAMILENLTDYNLEIYGIYPGWLRSPVIKYHKKRYLTGPEKAKVFFSSKICLNTIHYANIDGTNCRLFEIAGAGGFQIAEFRKSIPEYFIPDKEIVLYESIDDLKEKVNFYIRHPTLRWKIAQAGRKRALKEHTWEHRLRKLLKYLNNYGFIDEKI